MFGTRQHFDRLGSTSPRPTPAFKSHVRHVTSPRALDVTSSGMKKSTSDFSLHNLSDSSAYGVLESDDFINSLDHVIQHGRTQTPMQVPLLFNSKRQELSSTRKDNQSSSREQRSGMDDVTKDLDPNQW